MSWVSPVPEEQLKPETKRVYDFLRESWGFVPNYFVPLARDPQLLEDQVNLFTHAMGDRALPKSLKEQVALVVSGLNFSSYCLAAHMEVLGRMGMDKSLSRKLAVNYAAALAEPKVMELFRFADKLTRRPSEMDKSDVDRLREVGWTEEEIVEAVLVV